MDSRRNAIAESVGKRITNNPSRVAMASTYDRPHSPRSSPRGHQEALCRGQALRCFARGTRARAAATFPPEARRRNGARGPETWGSASPSAREAADAGCDAAENPTTAWSQLEMQRVHI